MRVAKRKPRLAGRGLGEGEAGMLFLERPRILFAQQQTRGAAPLPF